MVNRLFYHYFVAGHPIRHSLSPQLFHLFSTTVDLPLFYSRLNTTSVEDILTLLESGFEGCNITSPLKELICTLPFEKSSEVKKINAANLIYKKHNEWILENTDIIGVRESLKPFLEEIKNKPAAVIGAGGAARAAVEALKTYTQDIYLINRTFEKAVSWAQKLDAKPFPLTKAHILLPNTKTIINTLPIELPIEKHHIVLDANYIIHPLKEMAEKTRATYIPGEIWLLQQAIPSFELLTRKTLPKKIYHVENISTSPNIIFIGFMKSGKTTIGKKISELKGYHFLDLDEYLENKKNKRIVDIFKDHGENHFRQIEKETLNEIFTKTPSPFVLATGGGTVLLLENRDILKHRGHVIWLFATVDELLKRHDNTSRPLLKNTQDVVRLYHKRLPLYAEIADEIIVTDKKSLHEIIDLLKE